LLVDTLGLVLSCVVHAAGVQDRDGGKWVLAQATFYFVRLRVIRADAGYAGRLVEWTRQACHWSMDIIRRTSPGFVLLPKRWIVERTFAWLGKYRRHSKDYEVLESSSESFIYIAMIHIMVRRLN
jgi:putative transposase